MSSRIEAVNRDSVVTSYLWCAGMYGGLLEIGDFIWQEAGHTVLTV